MTQLGSPRILVVGDLLLDQYIHGTTERMSPEAAVPVFLDSGRVENRPGGAAAVACLAAALGGKVTLAGLVGWADAGKAANKLWGLCRDAGVNCDLVRTDHTREPTVKRRFVTPTGQVLRVDRESREPWTGPRAAVWRGDLVEACRSAEIVLLADYGKGTLTQDACDAVIGAHDRVIVDPARGVCHSRYEGAWGIKPNEVELADTVPIGCSWMLTTKGERGMVLQRLAPHSAVEIPARRRAVRDPTGCGDQVLSTLGVCLGSGIELVEACRWANAAAGLQVERVGIVPVGRAELIREVTGGKLVSAAEAAQLAHSARQQRQRVVFTNGVFDLFTAGHASCLREARDQGDVLFVGVNSDASARAIKGPGRPLRPEAERLAVLEAIAAVDYVTVFDEPTEVAMLKCLQPHVLVKGGDYRGREQEIPGRDYVLACGGRLHITERQYDVSTTAIAAQLAERAA